MDKNERYNLVIKKLDDILMGLHFVRTLHISTNRRTGQQKRAGLPTAKENFPTIAHRTRSSTP